MKITFNDDDKIISLDEHFWWARYSAVNTPEKLLKCVYCLSEKSNRISLADMRNFISLCVEKFEFSRKFGYDVCAFNAVPPES